MDRYINADLLKSYVNAQSSHWLNSWDTLGVLATIDKQPAADVRPVVHGHWIPIFLCESDKWLGLAADYKCSECNVRASDVTYSRGLDYVFCPHCGAKMDGKDGNK